MSDPTPKGNTTSVNNLGFIPDNYLEDIINKDMLIQENNKLASQWATNHPNNVVQRPVNNDKIDYPSTDIRSKDYSGNPNWSFAAPNMTGKQRADTESYHGDIIGGELAGLGVERLANKVYNAYKGTDKILKEFSSEIDWGKWNKEIPENKALMQSSNELPPPPNQIFIDGVPSFNLQRSGAKPKKNIYKKTESATENGLEIKTRYRGNKNVPADITVEGKSGYWQLRPNKSAGENTWYFSANMSNPLESGKAMLKINEKFPFPKPTILEPNNLSLDSYNNLLNMGKRKDWVATFENYIPLNYSSKNSKILEGLNIENTPNTSIFKTKKEAEEVVKRVNDFLPKKGIVQPARIFENRTTNTFGVEIPNFKLQRQYQNGGTIGNNGMFDMTNPNIYKAVIPAALLDAALQSQKQETPLYKNGGIRSINNNNIGFLFNESFGIQ